MDTHKEETERRYYRLPKKLDVGSRRAVWTAILESEDTQGIPFWRLVNKSFKMAMLSFLKNIGY